jgi:dTDP-4-dehydrorhamnose reductase
VNPVIVSLVQIETIRVNVLGMLNLADICYTHNIHLTTYATGCIFHYDKDFPENSGRGFRESDTPNFTGSYYSYTKVTPCDTVCYSACLYIYSPVAHLWGPLSTW